MYILVKTSYCTYNDSPDVEILAIDDDIEKVNKIFLDDYNKTSDTYSTHVEILRMRKDMQNNHIYFNPESDDDFAMDYFDIYDDNCNEIVRAYTYWKIIKK